MKCWRALIILSDAEGQIAYANKCLEDIHFNSFKDKEWEYKAIKDRVASIELTLTKTWNELERIEAENEKVNL